MKSIGIYGTYDLTHGFINIFYFLFNFHNLLTWHLLTNLRREIHENDIVLPKNNSHTPETTSKKQHALNAFMHHVGKSMPVSRHQ